MDVLVLDSCDGLLLLEIRGDDCDLVRKTPLLICNPVTISYRLLHCTKNLDMRFCYWKIMYDSSVREYKIVGVDTSWDREGTCYIMELQKHKGRLTSWKELSTPLSPDVRHVGASVFVEGKLYCLMTQYDEGRKHRELGILCIDIATEEVTYSSPILRPLSASCYLFSSGKKFYRTSQQRDEIEVSVLEDFDRLVWSKHHVIENTACDRFEPDFPVCHSMRPMIVLNLAGDDKLVMKHWDEIYTHHKSSKEWEWFAKDFKEFEAFRHPAMASIEYYVPHVNSLISWNVLDEAN